MNTGQLIDLLTTLDPSGLKDVVIVDDNSVPFDLDGVEPDDEVGDVMLVAGDERPHDR